MTTQSATERARQAMASAPIGGAPGTVAALTWLIAGSLAALIPAALDLNPFGSPDRLVPWLIGLAAVMVVSAMALRNREPWLYGLTVGLFAAFTVLVLRAALHGTPYAYEAEFGDTGRLSAMATRYTVNWSAVDGLGTGVASEYPPLFPWLIGKASLLLDVPAWRLIAPAEILAVSASVVAGFALWLRLVRAPVAAMIAILALFAMGSPNALGSANKAYEVLALAITVPWLLLTIGNPPRGRLHWLPAGLIGGLLLLIYYAYVAFCTVGLFVLVWAVWRESADQRAYLLHLLRVSLVTLLMGSWFLVPYLWGMTHGAQETSDTFQPAYAVQAILPFLNPTPLAVVELAGLIGLVYHRRTAWWSPPMMTLLGGCYAYCGVSVVRNCFTGHTGLYYYAGYVISAVLITAAVLTIADLAPYWGSRLRGAFRPVAAIAGMVLVVILGGTLYFVSNQPSLSPGGFLSYAHLQTLPNGSKPRYAALAANGFHPNSYVRERGGFPVGPLLSAVERVLGRDAMPRTLSYDEAIFAYMPWHGYLSVDRGAANALQRWDDRFAELNRLTAATDFANASAHTRFGPIDVFILRREGQALVWRSMQGATVSFRYSQFDVDHFAVVPLSGDYVVAIRSRHDPDRT